MKPLQTELCSVLPWKPTAAVWSVPQLCPLGRSDRQLARPLQRGCQRAASALTPAGSGLSAGPSLTDRHAVFLSSSSPHLDINTHVCEPTERPQMVHKSVCKTLRSCLKLLTRRLIFFFFSLLLRCHRGERERMKRRDEEREYQGCWIMQWDCEQLVVMIRRRLQFSLRVLL